MNQTQRILYEAACLIDTPEKWCKGRPAQDKRGNPVGTADPAAVRFCAIGAYWHFEGQAYKKGVRADVRDTLDVAFDGFPAIKNDAPDTTHADVMMGFAFAWAIAGDEA